MNPILKFCASLLISIHCALAFGAEGDAVIYVPELRCHDGLYRVSLPETVEALRKIGTLREERLVETLVWGDKSESHILELKFDALTLSIMSDGQKRRYSLAKATITDPRWVLAPNFRVGDSVAVVLKRLGRKDTALGTVLVFGGDTDFVSFKNVDGKISEIEIACYTG